MNLELWIMNSFLFLIPNSWFMILLYVLPINHRKKINPTIPVCAATRRNILCTGWRWKILASCLWTFGNSTRKLLSPTPKIGCDLIIENELLINSPRWVIDSSVNLMSENLKRKGENRRINPTNPTIKIFNLKFVCPICLFVILAGPESLWMMEILDAPPAGGLPEWRPSR